MDSTEPDLPPVDVSNTIVAVGSGALSKPAMSSDGIEGSPDALICSGDQSNPAKSTDGIQGSGSLNVNTHTSSNFTSKSGFVLTQQSTFDSFLPIWSLTRNQHQM